MSVHKENNDFYDRCPWDLQSFPFAVRIQVYVHFTLKEAQSLLLPGEDCRIIYF